MLHAVIMAGGSGKRFWPQSRHGRPKHLLPIAGARPMVAETCLRLEGLVPAERTHIVTHESHVAGVLESLGLGPPPHIIAEPIGRDTAACIGLAALHIQRADPDGVMLVMPADQVIHPVERFREVMLAAATVASRSDVLVTLGIKPRYAATGYGYLHRGAKLEEVNGISIYEVQRFREKPARAVADDYVASGEHYWNSGIFCWRVGLILDCLKRFTPKLYAALRRIGAAIATPAEDIVLREVYPPLEKISIDYAVLERAEAICLVEADFEWSDVGTWESVARLRHAEADAHGNLLMGRCEAIDATNTFIIGDDEHLIGLVGVEDLIVVRTPDATLICSKRRAEEVKQLVERLEKNGLDRYL